MRETARENRRKPGEPVRAGPGGRKRRGGGTGAGHDAGERQLLFSHRPLSSDFSGTSFFYEGRTGLFSAFPREELQETISSGVLLQGNDRRYEKVRKKRMKKQLVLAASGFPPASPSPTIAMAAEKNGWRSQSGGSVYYVKGTRVKGLKRDRFHRTHHFKKEDGTLLKNRWLLYKGDTIIFRAEAGWLQKQLDRAELLCGKGRRSCHQSMDR